VFSTPGVARPPSVMSDTDRSASAMKPPSSKVALAVSKNSRLNSIGNTPSAWPASSTTKRAEGSMGPPAPKGRAPVANMTTPTAQRRLSTATPRSTPKSTGETATPVLHKRTSSLSSDPRSSIRLRRQSVNSTSNFEDEKENMLDNSARRRSAIPVAA
jgi:hypothetical protein